MKLHTIFECEKCGKKSKDREEIIRCEASHTEGLSLAEQQEWERLKEDVQYKGYIVSTTKNENTDKDFDEAIKKVMEFEREHGMVV